MRHPDNVAGYFRNWLSMDSAEKEHVPTVGHLLRVVSELCVAVSGQHCIVFENQNARLPTFTSLLNYSQVATQAAVSPWKIIPNGRNLQVLTVECRKPNDLINSMFGESRLDSLPTIRSPVQVDTNLVGKKLVNMHRLIDPQPA